MHNTENILKKDEQVKEKYVNESYTVAFILGDHRAGTTLLYKLLGMSEQVSFLTAYHVINYEKIVVNCLKSREDKEKSIINNFLESKNIQNRGMDSVKTNSDTPEEYGFILKQYTNFSHVTESSYLILDELCKKISFISKENSLILLKNPYDCDNIELLSKLFPQAKFIVTTRNPRTHSRSKRRAASFLFREYSHYTALLSNEYTDYFKNKIIRYFILFYYSDLNFICRVKNYIETKKTKERILSLCDHVDKRKIFITNYERICTDTTKEINKINKFLDIKETKINYSQFIEK